MLALESRHFLPWLTSDVDLGKKMTREEAIEMARAFIATQPKDWRQEWPEKRPRCEACEIETYQ